MQKLALILAVLLLMPAALMAQQDTTQHSSLRCDSTRHRPLTLEWEANAYSFFDNTEFQGCQYGNSQTLSAVRLSPELGIGWQGKYRLMAGVHVQKNFGSRKFVDMVDFIAYFDYRQQHRKVSQHFVMGAFPRAGLLDNYSDFFIQDSIRYFRPNMTGFLYQIDGKAGFVNLWLDWTGLQTAKQRETFFIGLSGEARARAFVGGGEFYMFHYANTLPASGDGCVHDNIQGHLWAGIDLSYFRWRNVNSLRLTAGLMAGVERKRDDGLTPVKSPLGLVLALDANIWRFGINALYYYGDKRQTVPTDDHAATYWGTPLLQTGNYLQAHIYYDLFRWDAIKGRLGYQFHVADGRLYHQQILTLAVNLNRTTLRHLRRQR